MTKASNSVFDLGLKKNILGSCNLLLFISSLILAAFMSFVSVESKVSVNHHNHEFAAKQNVNNAGYSQFVSEEKEVANSVQTSELFTSLFFLFLLHCLQYNTLPFVYVCLKSERNISWISCAAFDSLSKISFITSHEDVHNDLFYIDNRIFPNKSNLEFYTTDN